MSHSRSHSHSHAHSRPRTNSTSNPHRDPTSGTSLTAPTSTRPRRNSQSHIESAINAIQSRNEPGPGGQGGVIGGPPSSNGEIMRKKSRGSKRDPTLFVLNGKRVRTTERICDEVPPPAREFPTEAQFWSRSDRTKTKPSLSFLRTHFQAEGRLEDWQALYILSTATKIFSSEPNMLKAGDGVTGGFHSFHYHFCFSFSFSFALCGL